MSFVNDFSHANKFPFVCLKVKHVFSYAITYKKRVSYCKKFLSIKITVCYEIYSKDL